MPAYLADLDAAGVQAVGLGLGAELPHQPAPEALITAAREIGMPLLTVPDPVPFIAVTKAVFATAPALNATSWSGRCRPNGRSPRRR